ncbi:hypothetical protein [Hydrogenophaga sp.]|uniref:hypothetical protein n=1 Tax=Hydrogenophaga sp. TaxID=1904254 RepID=UPI002727BA6C|nr:hypothetical protein [Hydrogenophaga sp.]MDO8905018.1 hypothetical protein [Hydrogenophaga sp.]
MVDEAAYRRTQAEVNHLPCVFRSAMLSRQAVCELAVRHSVAEREVLACSQAPAHLNCETLERLFLERATFPLKLRPGAPLTHGTVMRLHCGGLRGLQQVLNAPQPDVHRLVVQAQREHGSLVQLPWEHIVAQILATQPRRRASTPDA